MQQHEPELKPLRSPQRQNLIISSLWPGEKKLGRILKSGIVSTQVDSPDTHEKQVDFRSEVWHVAAVAAKT